MRTSPQVKKEFIELYGKYAPLWEKEEGERAKRWAAFVAGQHGNQPTCCLSLPVQPVCWTGLLVPEHAVQLWEAR